MEGAKLTSRRDQVSSLIEIHYALGIRSGASSSDPPRITNEDIVTSPIESPDVPPSLGGSTTVSSFEFVKHPRGSTGSSSSSFTLVEADPPEAPELESENPPPPPPSESTAVPTEEEEFLANMSGDTDEFGVRPRCLCLGLPSGLHEPYLVPQISPVRRHHPQGKS